MRLFGFSPTRSDRAEWALKELGIEYEAITEAVFDHPELRNFHPLGRVPALDIKGKGLFESAAICTYLADQVPEKNLIAEPRTWERALHDQWTFFALTEMEAWAWSTFRSTNIVPDEERVPQMYEYNKNAYRLSAVALESALAQSDYLIGNRFTVTDIIVSWTCQFGENLGYNQGFDHISAYIQRMKQRPHCTLKSLKGAV